MSTGTGWDGFITTLRTRKRVLIALTLAVVAGLVLGGAERGFASTALVGTDKTGYLAGQTVTLSGSGFTPSENVTLQVTHADSTAEAGMGHDAWVVVADDAGGLTATWSINPGDLAGNDFVLTADGALSGPTDPVAFTRIALVNTEFTNYQPGATANILDEASARASP